MRLSSLPLAVILLAGASAALYAGEPTAEDASRSADFQNPETVGKMKEDLARVKRDAEAQKKKSEDSDGDRPGVVVVALPPDTSSSSPGAARKTYELWGALPTFGAQGGAGGADLRIALTDQGTELVLGATAMNGGSPSGYVVSGAGDAGVSQQIIKVIALDGSGREVVSVTPTVAGGYSFGTGDAHNRLGFAYVDCGAQVGVGGAGTLEVGLRQYCPLSAGGSQPPMVKVGVLIQ